MSNSPAVKSLAGQSESWENEGGSAPANPQPESLDDVAERLGIERHQSETYTVGGYRYTNLADAVAQGRRMSGERQTAS